MSSVTMAADSTQADFVHHRVRPIAKATEGRGGAGRQGIGGGRGGRLMRRDRSESRHQSSSRSHKQKRGKEFQVKSRRQNDSHTQDDSSDRDSDLDLSKDLLPISGYVRIKGEMVDHMFHSISNRKMRAMLPEILKPLSTVELKKLCVEQLEVMSKKRICRILSGADPEIISSSGTEEDDDEEDEEEESKLMADGDGGGDDLQNVSTENEAVDSTSLHATDGNTPKESSASHLAEEDEEEDEECDKSEHPYNNSYRRDEVGAASEDVKGDKITTENDMQRENRIDKVSGIPMTVNDSLLLAKISKLSSRETEAEEDYGLSIKVNEGNYRTENSNDSDDHDNSFGREESMKTNKRCMERVYRAKQLDDDERDYDSNGEVQQDKKEKWTDCQGVIEMEKSLGDGLHKDQSKAQENELSENESIPSSLPGLDSEPEETCCPFVILDSQEKLLKKVIQMSNKPSDDVSSSSNHFPDGSEAKLVNAAMQQDDRKAKGPSSVGDDKKGSENEKSRVSDKGKQSSLASFSALQLSSKLPESGNEGEEMIIEIQDHEFSDDADDDEDFHGKSKKCCMISDKKKTTLKEEKELMAGKCKVGTNDTEAEAPQRRLEGGLQESPDEKSQRLLDVTDKVDLLGRHKICEDEIDSDQRGLKRKSIGEMDNDEAAGDTKIQKLNSLSYDKCDSDKRPPLNSKKKKVPTATLR